MTQKRSIDTDLSQDRCSSFSPSLSVSTSYSSLPSPSFPSSALPQVVPRPPYFSSHHSNDFPHPPFSNNNHYSLSSHIEDVLSPGDVVGEGFPLLGELLRLVSNRFSEHFPAADHQDREVLSRSPPSEDGHFYPGGRLEFDDVSVSRSPLTEHGHEYAIKLLFKADLDEEEVVAQLTEVRFAPYLSLLQVLRKNV